MSQKPKDPIRLTRLEVRHYQKIRAVDFLVSEGLNIVTSGGENGQGKSSLLNVICDLFLGAGATPERPINEDTPDEDLKAQAKAWLSNGWRVELVHTDKGRYLRVKGPDGRKGNQTTLNGWVGTNALQLGQFWKLSDEEKTERILNLSPQDDLQERLRENAEQHAKLYDERTPEISEQRRLRAVKKPKGTPPEPVDVSATAKRLRELQEAEKDRARIAQAHNEKRAETRRLGNEVDSLDREIAELEAQLARKRELRENTHAAMEKGKKEVRRLRGAYADMEDPSEQIAALQERIEVAEEVNRELEPWREWERAQDQLEEANERVAKYTEMIRDTEQERVEMLANAEIPVEGLSVDVDGKLMLNDRPLSSASGAERALLEVQAGIAENPQLRLIVVDEADGLGKAKLAELREIATRYDFDIIIARVDLNNGPSELEILDGAGSNLPEGWGEEDGESDEEPEETPGPKEAPAADLPAQSAFVLDNTMDDDYGEEEGEAADEFGDDLPF